MLNWVKRIGLLVLLLVSAISADAQKYITYEAGMGTRDMSNPDVWILYNRVKAMHDGMVLRADSAQLNSVQNDLSAYGHIKIELTDTTTIYGDRLFYDGNSRVVDIWADTVRFVDGKTVLKTNHLSYDRNTSMATYNNWGHTVNEGSTLDSRIGHYDSDTKIFYIYESVVLQDSSSRLETDTLTYDYKIHTAYFVSPTYIYSDSTVIYSERGSYNTDTRYALSTKASQVVTGEKQMNCDTLHFYQDNNFGQAYGHVVIQDTANKITCTGRYGETTQLTRRSFVTDSALVVMLDDNGDTTYIHADTVMVTNDSVREFQSISAYHHVKLFRNDAQGMCDSAYYYVPDSLLTLYHNPVLWYGNYQCTADTILMYNDTDGVRLAYLNGSSFNIEKVDAQKFNQLKGKRSVVYFSHGEPSYADILGNAQMVYYITEEGTDGTIRLVGVNAGIGSDMRIYFVNRAPERVVTYGKPDMHTYPLSKLPEDLSRLPGFRWVENQRPHNRQDIFKW